jgi:hypothetical protein
LIKYKRLIIITARERVKNLIAELPLFSRDLLEATLNLMWQVAKNAGTNLMNATNLSVMFGPNLLKDVDPIGGNSLIKFMIEEYLFGVIGDRIGDSTAT